MTHGKILSGSGSSVYSHRLGVIVDSVQRAVDLETDRQVEEFLAACGQLAPFSLLEFEQAKTLALRLLLAAPVGQDPFPQLARLKLAHRASTIEQLSGALQSLRGREKSADIGPDVFRRWAVAVARIVPASDDPPTLSAWARLLAVSPETVRTWCKAAHVPAKGSLDLGRILRAARCAQQTHSPLRCFFNVAHPRTLGRLCALVYGPSDSVSLGVSDALVHQRIIVNPGALKELQRVLRFEA